MHRIAPNILWGALGILLLSFSIVIRLKIGFGLDSLNALYANLAVATGLTIGFFSVFLGFIFILMNMIVQKKRFNFIAMLVAFFIGVGVDLFSWLMVNVPNLESAFGKTILFSCMVILGGMSIALLIYSAMPSPLEEYQFALQKLFGLSIASSKFYTDLSLLIVAAIVGFVSGNYLGQINVGTVMTIVVTGKIVDLSLKVLGLFGKSQITGGPGGH